MLGAQESSLVTSDGISLVFGGAELLGRIEPLWLELRRHHAELAPLWGPELLAATFESRRDGLRSKGANGLIVLLAVADGQDAGYCVGTVDALRRGELDSLFVTAPQRGRGIGRALTREALLWLGARSVGAIVVDVLSGNERALRLYEGFGFRARTVRMLYLPDTKSD